MSQEIEVRELRNALSTSVARFHFRKLDGSIREALGTRNTVLIPKGDHTPRSIEDQSSKAIVYWDLEEEGFRSVSVKSLVWI